MPFRIAAVAAAVIAAAGSSPAVAKEVPPQATAAAKSAHDFKTAFGKSDQVIPYRVMRWPTKPFAKAKPIRATFGEARSIQMDRKGLTGMDYHAHLYAMNQVSVPGPRIIHDGIDIVVKKGTPVYALENGKAKLGGNGKYARWVRVANFRYDHITPLVRNGQKVTAFKTVIGRIATPDHHLHLTRYHKGKAVNPLSHGTFVGYKDTARPELGDFGVYTPEGARLNPGEVRGRVAFTINARDFQSSTPLRQMYSKRLINTGQWNALSAEGRNRFAGTGIYTLSYTVETNNGEPVYGPQLVYQPDVRPPAFAGDRLYQVASNRNDFVNYFWYRLTVRSPDGDGFINTDNYAPGDYRVRVDAADVKGNRTTGYFPFTIAPR